MTLDKREMSFKLSVVTISYNACSSIERTLESVGAQKNRNFEYVVLDGASSDGTVEVIQSYSDMISCFVSERDGGISDALNKSLRLIAGDYVVFLHADDYFFDNNCVDRIYDSISSGEDVVSFDIGIDSKSGIDRLSSRGFDFYTHFKTPFYHPGTACRVDMLRRLGGFDTRFKVAMDYDLFLRAYLNGATYKKVHSLLTVFGDEGISSRQDLQSLKMRLNEEVMVHRKNDRGALMRLVHMAWWALYRPYKLYLR